MTSVDYYAASTIQCLLTVFSQVMPDYSSRHECPPQRGASTAGQRGGLQHALLLSLQNIICKLREGLYPSV